MKGIGKWRDLKYGAWGLCSVKDETQRASGCSKWCQKCCKVSEAKFFYIEEENKTRMRSYKISLERFTALLETNSSGDEEGSIVTCIFKILK